MSARYARRVPASGEDLSPSLARRSASLLVFTRDLVLAGLAPPRFDPELTGAALDADTIVVVTSTIRPISAPMSYGRPRSVLDAATRLEQTEATLASVRARLPDAAVVLVESSGLAQDERVRIENLTDRLVDLSHDRRARRLRDGRSKSAGEAYLLLASQELLARSRYELMLKLSGRYVLTKDFRFDRFPHDRFGYARQGTRAATRLYSVPASLGPLYERQLRRTLRAALGPRGRPAEEVLFAGMPARVLERVGVRGVLGSTGLPIDE